MLSSEEKNWTWAVIGKQAAFKLQDNASEYFAKVHRDSDLNDELLMWKVRAALRSGQWRQVLSATEALSPEAQKDPAWVYWRARALLASASSDAQREIGRASCRERVLFAV